MERTTSISHLPSSGSSQSQIVPQTSNNSNNIQMVMQETERSTQYSPTIPQLNNNHQNQMVSSGNQSADSIIPNAVPTNDVNQILHQIESTAAKNLNTLPPRDIPIDTSRVIRDEKVKPNYIPPMKKEEIMDVLREMKNEENHMMKNAMKNEKESNIDILYSDLQEPVIAMILFFLFQLPVANETFKRFFPFLITKDGYPRISGYILKTCLFGGAYFAVSKFMGNLGDLF